MIILEKTINAALSYAATGLSVIPVRLETRTTTLTTWKTYQEHRADTDTITQWFSNSDAALAIVCGQVSGNLEVIDFDEKHNINESSLFERWKEIVEQQQPGLVAKLVIETSQSHGYHAYYRCDSIDGNQKLAERLEEEKSVTLIETRGEGGYVLCNPSPGYSKVTGSLTDIPRITSDERELLLTAARMLTTYIKPSQIVSGLQTKKKNDSTLRPGDDFNERGDVQQILEEAGWTLVGTPGNVQHWCRPGKTDGISATFNHVPNMFYVFSSNASPFDSLKGYSRFAVYTILKHNGNFEAAAKDLAQQGYGDSLQVYSEGPATIVIAEEYLRVHYKFKYNIITGKVEFCKSDGGAYKQMDERELNSFLRELNKANIQVGVDGIARLLHSDFVPSYDPFKEYFEALPVWNQDIDHIKQLADTITMKDAKDGPLFQNYLRRWLIAQVACAIDEKKTNHTAIIFVGEQGKLKTTWLNNLIPPSLADYRFAGTIYPDNKDSLICLSECFLINLDELETLRKNEIGSLKTLMTLDKIKVRRPYDREQSTLARRASFVGSINNSEFLSDPTGSRRFLIFDIESINVKHNVNMDHVYAQAYALFNAKEQHWFDQAEISSINERNKVFDLKTTEDELVIQHFKPADPNDVSVEWKTATEIANIFSQMKGGIPLKSNSAALFGAALTKAGFKSKKSNGKKLYAVKKDLLRYGITGTCWPGDEIGSVTDRAMAV